MSRNTGYVEFDSIITADGEEYRLHDRFRKFVLSVTGEGHPPISYITQRGPGQHGSTVIDYRLEDRIIQYTIAVTARNRYDYWDNRELLLDILRPNRQTDDSLISPIKLRKYYSNGKKRQINVVVEAGPTFQPRNPSDHNEYYIQESVRFIAHDPIYYDPTEECEAFIFEFENHLVFPITFPIRFGIAAVSNTLDITYIGTWKTFPVIQITGPVNGPKITNSVTGKIIKLNYNIPGGRIVTINTQYGNKSIVDDLGTNLIGVIDNPIDLTTFEIVPAPRAPGGVNTLVAGGYGMSENTLIQVAFYNRYFGI